MFDDSDEPTGRLALVFELMDMNLYDAIKGKSMTKWFLLWWQAEDITYLRQE